MDSPTTKLWYQLCNTKGEELSDSSSIRLTAEVEIVAELRKAVWNKWKQDALLKDVTAGRLLVYKDKAALDNGTALDGRYKVKDLQETDQQPLQIVVPERVPPTPSGLPNLSSLESKLDVLIKYSDLISRGISSLMEMELSYTEGNETGGSAARQFKTKLVRATMGKTHSKHIIAGHLFKHAWEHLMWMVDLQDINDANN
ncbi:hypothetical protein DFS34DRAFT_695726 [Phlyctochytrium arcticum]|nr:hypothetical protein DFS34DRAFT_695726 [Phlyctochytrium arcticum]